MDGDAAPAVTEAATNGEVDKADLPGRLEDLSVSQESDGATAGPEKTGCQGGTRDDSGTGRREPAENGTAHRPPAEENGTTAGGKAKNSRRSEDGGQDAAERPGREKNAVPPGQEPGRGGGAAAAEGDPESAPLTYRWQLADEAAPDAADPPALVFGADLIAREASSRRLRPPAAIKKLMESYHIYSIKKPPSHHKNAKYVCRVCELHWDSLPAVQKHVNDQRHAESTRRHQELTAVHTLPEPTPAQRERLTELLTEVYSERGLTEPRLAERRRVADQLRDTLREGLSQRYGAEDWRVEVFGSSRHGCGFRDSALDLALLPAEESAGSGLLTEAIQVLQRSQLFTEVAHDFHSWTPHLLCVEPGSGLQCRLALGADRDLQLARLLQMYTALDGRVAPLAVALRHLARVCEMDRPQAGSLPPSAFVLMTLYYLQQCRPPVLPVLQERAGAAAEDETADQLDLAAAAAAAAGWRSENPADLGTLWLQLLRFYALELADSDAVVSIRQRQPVTRADKGWNNKKISIEDPVQSKRNISRSISSSLVADLIVDRLRAACLLFGVPRTAAGAAVRLLARRGPPPPAAAALMAQRLAAIPRDQLQYQFDRHLLCGETSMPVVCSVCQKTGHLADDCSTLVVPPAEPLPEPSPQQIQLIDRICRSVFSDWAPPAEEYRLRQELLRGIETYIRYHGFPAARLTLFGSSCNGFGFRNSDLDICMTFEDCDDPQSLDQPEIIRQLAGTLSRLRSVYNVIPISTAKVPIVKFTDRRSRLEGDISLYNTLAQHNTLLLHTYAKLDSRARILGYMVKIMAKICDICDASRGSLSSYAYTLLLIYYLQRCRPPVLPVLQELDSGRQPSLVDGADVSFFTQLDRLPQLWPEAGQNTVSVGELWLGFLRFYGEHFDFERNVVCIRRRETLTKFEKLWNGAFIAIEDPFLLSHNLGGGVRRKMASFIRRTLLLWRRHHLRPAPTTLPHGYRDFRAFLMSPDHLCEGPPPNAGGCHMCGRIGHWAADCPRRNRRRPPAAGKQRPHRTPGSPTKAETAAPDRSPTKAEGQRRPPAGPVNRAAEQRTPGSPTKAEARPRTEPAAPDRSPTKAEGQRRPPAWPANRAAEQRPPGSPTKAEPAAPDRSPTKAGGSDRAETEGQPANRAAEQRTPDTAAVREQGTGPPVDRAAEQRTPDTAAAREQGTGPPADSGPAVTRAALSAAAAAAAAQTAAPAAEKKPRKRARRRKLDKAERPAAAGPDSPAPQHTVVFYNSNHGGGATGAAAPP